MKAPAVDLDQMTEVKGEEELREVEERFSLLVDSVKDYAIFMLDAGGHVATWNRGAQRIKGYAANEIVGKHFSTFYPREDVEAGKCELELDVASTEGRFEDEGWRVRKDGSRFWANVVITALRNAKGELVGFGKVTRDLTDRVRAEQERIERVRAEEGERRKEEFLAIMGHELRNPLSPMLTAVHILKLRRGIGCEREIAVLDRQLVQMLRLLDDLLDVSRILRDKLTLAKRPMLVGEVLANAVDVSASHIEKRRHRLRLDVPDAPIVIDVDPERITQVFSNLLNNAAKYTDEGGEIVVSARTVDGAVDIVVKDNGIGLAPESLTRIFDLFSQAAETKERQLGGFGIGLAVARRLVAEHGGTIRADSAGIGRGSTFTVTLPRSKEILAPEETSSVALRRAPEKKRVLIVDDNRDSAEMLEALLTRLGHEVRVALDGSVALDVARELKPDIAFLDIGLPGMDGFEVVRRMRQIPCCGSIPIIAVTGYTRDSDRREAIRAGFTQHVAKPIDLVQLEGLVENAGRTSAIA